MRAWMSPIPGTPIRSDRHHEAEENWSVAAAWLFWAVTVAAMIFMLITMVQR